MTEYKYQYALDALKVFSNKASITEISLAFVGASIADFRDVHCLKDYGFDMAYEMANHIQGDIHTGIVDGAIPVFQACFEEERGRDEPGMVWVKSDVVDTSRLDQYCKVTFNDLEPVFEYVTGCIEKRGEAWSSQLAAVAAQKPSVSEGMLTSEKKAFELNALYLKSKTKPVAEQSTEDSFSEKSGQSKTKPVDEEVSDKQSSTSFSEKNKQRSQNSINSAKGNTASRNKARVLSLWLALVARDGYEETASLAFKKFQALPEMKELARGFQCAYKEETMKKDFSYWKKGRDAGFTSSSLALLEEMLARLASPAVQLADSKGVPMMPMKLPKIVSEVLKGRDVVKCIVAALNDRGRSLPGIIPVTAGITPVTAVTSR